MKVISSGRPRVALVDEGRELPLQVRLGAAQHRPDAAHGLLQGLQGAVLGGDGALPVPLVDVGAVVVVEEVVLAHRSHVGAQAGARAHPELAQRHALPLGGGLHDLGVDGVDPVVVGDVERHRGARAVPVQHVVHPGLGVDDQGHLHHLETELAAQAVLDVAPGPEDRTLGLAWGQQ